MHLFKADFQDLFFSGCIDRLDLDILMFTVQSQKISFDCFFPVAGDNNLVLLVSALLLRALFRVGPIHVRCIPCRP